MTEADPRALGQSALASAPASLAEHGAAASDRAARAHAGARFVSSAERARARAELEKGRALVVGIEAIGASARGRLADVVEEAIERELDARGAAPPGIGSTSDADAALSDQ